MNPFSYGQIVKGTDFCRRPELVKKLAENIKRGQNVYIQGERRTGKSSLIFETIRTLKKFRTIYTDLLEVKSSDDFIKRMVMAVISMEKSRGYLDKVFQKLSHIRPVASIDPITGLPTLTIDAAVELQPNSIGGVLDLIASYHSKTRPIVVVFDEFQDILNLKDARQTLALLRSKVQFQTHIAYVFAGSIRNKMDSIFNDPDSAFFKSAIPIHVGPLDSGIFHEFIKNRFNTGKRQIDPEAIGDIFDICFKIPGDVQQLCSALWDTTAPGEQITAVRIPVALELIFSHELKGYETILKIVSSQQLKLLTALARLGGKAPMSSAFLKNSGIAQASSIQRALGRLIDLRIIFHYENEYRFVNPFFRAWLLHKNL
jgi:archaellum biogenesis ATPase FlaH